MRNSKGQFTRGLVCGVGINDLPDLITPNGVQIPSYRFWAGMLRRCYSEKELLRSPTYKGCTVCAEWLRYSAFKEWWDANFVEGFCLDKDIVKRGNREYAPDTCSFVPNAINILLCSSKAIRGGLPIGVSFDKSRGLYVAKLKKYGKTFNLGRFTEVRKAFEAYKLEKEAYIKEVAQRYFAKGQISRAVFDALNKYQIEYDD